MGSLASFGRADACAIGPIAKGIKGPLKFPPYTPYSVPRLSSMQWLPGANENRNTPDSLNAVYPSRAPDSIDVTLPLSSPHGSGVPIRIPSLQGGGVRSD